MGGIKTGQVVVLPFPFSDLTQQKFRPALVLADGLRGDWILCQITSNPYADTRAVVLSPTDFSAGGLPRVSHARPGKLFTAHESLISGTVGHLKNESLTKVRAAVISLFQND